MWNNILNIVKEDKEAATGKSQYSGGEGNISNSNNYVVSKGIYQLTKEAWTKILNIVKQALGVKVENKSEDSKTTEVVNKIGVIDSVKNSKTGETYSEQDMKISANEAAAHLMSMAQLCDNKNAITKSEFNGAEFAIQFEGYTLEEIKAELGCDDKTAKSIYDFANQYAKNMEVYMPHLNK